MLSCWICIPSRQFLKAMLTISLSGKTARLYQCTACLYTTARLFINCPNKTKWENTGEVRKVSIDPCSLLRTAGSRLDFGLYKYIEPQLPDVATLKDVRLQIPMQVYSADGELIAQYGEKRRIPVTLQQIPRAGESVYRHRRQPLL